MPWYCITCKYQKHVKQQEERVRHLERELRAARKEIYKLEGGIVSSNFMQHDIQKVGGGGTKIPNPESVGSLRMMLISFN
jgi:predicted RNase H-like nuclease (RuvC/YqgF family)